MLKVTKFVEQGFVLSVKATFSYHCQGQGQHIQVCKKNDLLLPTNDSRTDTYFCESGC